MLGNTPAVIDLGVSSLPSWFFIIVHVAALIIAGFFAYRAFGAARSTLAWGFTLYAVGEVSYILYHVQPPVTTFLLSHTLSEVLVLVAFILIFVGVGDLALEKRGATSGARA